MDKHYNEDFGNGRMYRAAQVISCFFLTTIVFILNQALLFFFFLFVEPTLLNIVWYLIGLIPVGPAIAALTASTIYAIEYSDYSDPIKGFIKFYRSNFKDTLVIWLPYLLLTYLFAVNINYYFNVVDPIYSGIGWLFITLLIVLNLILIPLMMITVKFQFRLRDRMKLALYSLFRHMTLTIGNLLYGGIIIFLILRVSEWIVFFLPTVIIYLLILYNFRIIKQIKAEFIADEEKSSY